MRKGSKYWQLNDKQWLYQKYWVEKLTLKQIAKIIGCSERTVSEALKKFNIPRRTISEIKKGMPCSEETKRKLSEALKGEKSICFGKPRTKETKQKISKATRGKRRSEETKAKISKAHKGKKLTKEQKLKISQSLKGRIAWNKGKNLSEEHRKKIGDAEKGEKNYFYGKRFTGNKNPMYRKHHTEESKQKMREARKHRIFPKHHTKPEMIYEEICKKSNLPYKYTGDSSFWIGKGKDTINPDFMHLTRKVVVEIFSWHHDELRNHHVRQKARYEVRKRIYKKYGYKMIVFWQDDLEREDIEQFVLSVLKKEKAI